ncbi:MAG: MFS transporter, partial [Actinobacteria bacterium]|nr:MFS transporter [Actinomycetota bacterium]
MKSAQSEHISIGTFKFHRAWIILIGCCFLQAGALGAILISQGVFYVPVCDELGFARSQFSLWVTAYNIATIFCLPIAGKIIQKYSIRVVMTICTLAVVAASAFMGTYTELWQFILSGAIYGSFGACVFMLPYSSMISEWFSKRAGLAMGIASCVAALAAAGFAPFFQSIITQYGWRMAYFVQAGIVAVLVLPWTLFVFRLRPSDVGIHAYGYGTEVPAHMGIDKTKSDGEAVFDDMTTGVPYKKALRTGSFIMLFIAMGIAALVGSGYDAHMPGLGISFGLATSSAALLVSSLQLGSFFMKLVVGVLNDKIGVKLTVYIQFIVIVIAIIGIILFREPWLLFAFVFIFGIQDSLVAISAPLLVRQVFGGKDFVQLNAWIRVGMGVFGAFASVFVGMSYDITGGFVPALAGGIILCAVGLLCVVLAYGFR